MTDMARTHITPQPIAVMGTDERDRTPLARMLVTEVEETTKMITQITLAARHGLAEETEDDKTEQHISTTPRTSLLSILPTLR
jgi:hypothetical protein